MSSGDDHRDHNEIDLGHQNVIDVIVSHALPISCCVIEVYLSVCQIIVFGYKVHQKKIGIKVKGRRELLNTANLSFLMSLAMIFASLFGVVYLVLSTLHHVGTSRGLYSVLMSCLMLSFLTMYLVLWLRQTSFYTEPAIRQFTNPFTRCMSLFQGVIIVTAAIAFTVIQVQQIFSSDCFFPHCRPIPTWVSIVITSLQLEVQVALLILFVLPLVKHKANMKGVAKTDRRDPHLRLVVRAVVVTALSIIIDIASIALFFSTFSSTVYNIAAVTNLICTIFCFGGYKARFLPCYLRRASVDGESNSSGTMRARASTKMENLRCNPVAANKDEATTKMLVKKDSDSPDLEE